MSAAIARDIAYVAGVAAQDHDKGCVGRSAGLYGLDCPPVSIPGLPSLHRPKCPSCGRTLDLGLAIRLDEKTTDRFDGLVPRVSGLCSCHHPFAIDEDGTVRAADIEEIAMLVISRPALADVLLQHASENLGDAQFAEVAATFVEIRRRYPRDSGGPPG